MAPPQFIDERAQADLEILAQITTDLAILARQGEEMSPTELLTMQQEFVREKMDDSSEDIDLVPINELVASMNPSDTVDNLPEDVDHDKSISEEILSGLSSESRDTGNLQSLEELVEFPFDDVNEVTDEIDVVDTAMTDGFRKFTRFSFWILPTRFTSV